MDRSKLISSVDEFSVSSEISEKKSSSEKSESSSESPFFDCFPSPFFSFDETISSRFISKSKSNSASPDDSSLPQSIQNLSCSLFSFPHFSHFII